MINTKLSRLKVSNLEEDNKVLNFTIENVNVSYVNGLRRIMLANVPIIVFKTYPYKENQVSIEINKTRFNNELIKQRMSCIPIHIDDIDNFSYQDYIIELHIKNDTNETIYATTQDFKIKNIKLNKYLNNSDVIKIFPPNSLTGDYIDIARLRSKIGDNNNYEELKLSAKLLISTAEDDGAFNIVSMASYGNTLDAAEIKKQWEIKESELKKTNNTDEIEELKKDWLLIDAKKYSIKDSFDFKLQSIGIYRNIKIIDLSCKILIKKLFMVLEDLKNDLSLINEIPDGLENCFHITIKNEDYTVGKIIENYLYKVYFIEKKEINYVSFLKKHPHDKDSIIKISYKSITNKDDIISQMEQCINYSISTVNSIQEYFVS